MWLWLQVLSRCEVVVSRHREKQTLMVYLLRGLSQFTSHSSLECHSPLRLSVSLSILRLPFIFHPSVFGEQYQVSSVINFDLKLFYTKNVSPIWDTYESAIIFYYLSIITSLSLTNVRVWEQPKSQVESKFLQLHSDVLSSCCSVHNVGAGTSEWVLMGALFVTNLSLDFHISNDNIHMHIFKYRIFQSMSRVFCWVMTYTLEWLMCDFKTLKA